MIEEDIYVLLWNSFEDVLSETSWGQKCAWYPTAWVKKEGDSCTYTYKFV